MHILADPHPENERRLAALHSYDVLDSKDEADFDDIVELASIICDVPVSLISLVEDDRQWFKSRLGFDPHETPMSQSVCSHAILQDDILVIEDMSLDPRTKDNTLHTQSPQVNFYAGANLMTPEGLPIGTLCVLDTKPRVLSEFQRTALRTLSRQVMTQLELRKKIKQEVALRDEIDHRVKNSLQTITSVMRLATRRVSDPAALDVLALIERRIGAVASLHTELMRRNGDASVNARNYLDRVANLLSDVAPDNITIVVTASDGEIDARKASAVGMIVSEFVANSIKHAFPDERSGKVELSLKTTDDLNWELVCADDGVGDKAQNLSQTSSSGLGEVLMSSAASQLQGTLEQEIGKDGTTLMVTFR